MKEELRTAKVSVARVHEEYENKAESPPASEPMTFGYVDAALTTFDRGLCLHAVNECVLKCQTKATVHPFDSVYKLQGIIQKGSRPHKIEWLCIGLCDLFISGAMAGDEFSISQITGGKQKKSGQSAKHCLADVLLLKLEMKEYLLGPWLGTIQIDEELKVLIRKCLANHASYRAHMGGLPDDAEPDLSWKSGGWPKSANEALFFIEARL